MAFADIFFELVIKCGISLYQNFMTLFDLLNSLKTFPKVNSHHAISSLNYRYS